MTKREYYKKFEINQLIEELYKAVEFLRNPERSYEGEEFETKELFILSIEEELDEIEHWNGAPIEDHVYNWFKPDATWNKNYNCIEGETIRMNIYSRINYWKTEAAYKP